MKSGIKTRLDAIRRSGIEVKSEIDKILEKDERIEIATVETEKYAQDLYALMRKMAETANPVLKKMGLSQEAITHDIEEFVSILADNPQTMYFASVNIDAKYKKNKYALLNISNWLARLITSIDRIEGFLESETEANELKVLFKKVDATTLSKATKEELKAEFLKALNRLNKV
jgi:hypothetical protein